MSDAVVKQRASVYTMMLVVSFLCLALACVFLYFEMDRFEFMTKVPDGLRAKDAETMAATEAEKGQPAEDEVDPAANPMPDPNAPMPDPNAAPMPDPNAAPMPDPAMPAEPAAN